MSMAAVQSSAGQAGPVPFSPWYSHSQRNEQEDFSLLLKRWMAASGLSSRRAPEDKQWLVFTSMNLQVFSVTF
jgi:hypothetical protein